MLGEKLRARRERKFLEHAIVVGSSLIKEGEITQNKALQNGGSAMVVASLTEAAKLGLTPRVRLRRLKHEKR